MIRIFSEPEQYLTDIDIKSGYIKGSSIKKGGVFKDHGHLIK